MGTQQKLAASQAALPQIQIPQRNIPTDTSHLPRRPGVPECAFYMKTGECQHGASCKWDHPDRGSPNLNSWGFPLRDGEPNCAFYMKNGDCKFGPMCKFNHPEFPGYVGTKGPAAAALASFR